MIADPELKWPMPPVGIAFLAALGGFHWFLDYPYLVRGRLDQFWSDSQDFANLLPTERSPTFPPIQCLVRGHANARVVAVVVREFDQCQLFVPYALKIQGASPQHIFQGLNSTFSLSIRYRVKASAKT